MDVLAVEDAARMAVEAVRSGAGPHFLELRTYRFRAHSMYDPDRYRDKAEIEDWKTRDPIELLDRLLRSSDALDDQRRKAIEAEIEGEIDDAVANAEAGTDEMVEDLLRFVHSEPAAPGADGP
jgi:pyruvate dehydrogenase E1 component alpha subunit